MLFMLLINGDEKLEETIPEQEMMQMMGEYGALDEALHKAGVYVRGDRLRSASTATTVRIRNGKATLTDGPFAETKEQFGGYYLIDVKDLDEAIGWAKRVPSTRYGSVEVRPVWPSEEYMPPM